MRHPVGIIGAAFVVFVVSCGPSQSQGTGQAPVASSDQPAQNRTLVVGHRIEPSNLAPKVLGTNGPLRNSRFFNAALSRLYIAIGDPGVIEVFDTAPLRRRETITTEAGAHTLSFDAARNIVCAFLPGSHRAGVYEDHA